MGFRLVTAEGASGSDAGWQPLETSKHQNAFAVPANTVSGAVLDLTGPAGEDVTGRIGTFHAFLQLIDGAPPSPDQAVQLDMEFIAV